MKRFAAVLHQASGKLQIPEPSRSRILLEIASDLEDSFQYHLAQGCDEAEAVRRAEEAFAAFVFTVWKLYQILVLPGRDVRRLRTGLGVLLFLAGASLAMGIFGMLYHLRRFANLAVEGAPPSIFQMFAPWTFGISSMMTLGLLTAVLAALVWFVLINLVTRSELREVESLLEAEA